MKLVVNDANILIDIAKLELVNQFFRLNLEFYTTDWIFDELHKSQQALFQPYIQDEQLIISELNDEEMVEAGLMTVKENRLSIQDCSAFIFARNTGGCVLTSDNRLRKFIKQYDQEVHGHLWVLRLMVEENIISRTFASEKLKQLNEINPKLKLPQTIVEELLSEWGE